MDLPVTPEITKPNGGNSKRRPLGKASSSSEEKIIPHYLRASTGSCHDFCKYGRKHAFEEAKARHPIPRRLSNPLPVNQIPMSSMILPERKRTIVVRPKSSPISKTSVSDVPEIIKREVSTTSPDGPNVLNVSVDGQNPAKGELLSGIKKTSASKIRPSHNPKPRLSESPKFKRQVLSSSSKMMDVSLKPTLSKSEETNVSAKHATSLKTKALVQKPLSSPDHSGSLSGRSSSDIKTGKRTGPPKVAVKKMMASPRVPLAPPRASLSPKPSISRVGSLNARKQNSLKVVSSLKNQGKTKKAEPQQPKIELKPANNDLVQEKTLYVIKMETENRTLESDQNKSCAVETSPPLSSLLTKPLPTSPPPSSLLTKPLPTSPPPSSLLTKTLPTSPSSSSHNEDQENSEYTETETEVGSLSESEFDETMSMEEEKLGVEHPGRPKMDRMVHSEDKGSQAMKLRFRRGKVVDIQSGSNSPTRLKFRRGRVLGENQNLKADGRRNFKKKGVDGETNDSKPDSEKVVLRHQDMQGKKDSQILFNNVIEETASKLVETRKSKVKALVGAFETVISLQETKPSANTST